MADKFTDHPDSKADPDGETLAAATRADAALDADLTQRIPRVAILESTDPALPMARLYAALALAQGAFPEIPKNRTATVRMKKGGQFSYKYSDLADLINATRPSLTANGLAIFQTPDLDRKNCITTLAHSSGLTLVGGYPIHHNTGEDRMHPAQDWSISWAYARRYGMSGLLGIAAEETVEGDQSDKTTPTFEDAGGDGILSVRGVVVPPGATKAEKAKMLADGIEAQLADAATVKGIDGVYERNLKVINVLQDHFPADHGNVLEAYEITKRGMEDEA